MLKLTNLLGRSLAIAIIWAGAVASAWAQWTTSTTANTLFMPFASNTSLEYKKPPMVSDGANGAIVATSACTGSGCGGGPLNYNVYIQRINSTGQRVWNSGQPRTVVATAANETDVVLEKDNQQGAVVGWLANSTMYAQKVNASGELSWLAGVEGVQLAPPRTIPPSDSSASGAAIASDGANGAFFAWTGSINGSLNDRVYLQHLDANGNKLCNGANGVRLPENAIGSALISNGAGGAIVAYYVSNGNGGGTIYLRRLDAGCQTINNIVTRIAVTSRFFGPLRMVTDGAGGAIVAWLDGRSNARIEAYAQRIQSNGTILWQTNGNLVSPSGRDTKEVDLTAYQRNGAVMAFAVTGSDYATDIVARHFDGAGSLWWETGLLGQGRNLVVVRKENSCDRLHVTWETYNRFGTIGDIYTRGVSYSGAAQTTTLISNAASHQVRPGVISTTSGLIFSWVDSRTSSIQQVYGHFLSVPAKKPSDYCYDPT